MRHRAGNTARHPLTSVFLLIQACVIKPSTANAIAVDLNMSAAEAEAYLRESLRNLQPAHFVDHAQWRLKHKNQELIIADVYGVKDEHGDWYVKLHITNGTLFLDSWHPPDGEMVCAGGAVVRPWGKKTK